MLIDRGVRWNEIPNLSRYLVKWLFNHPRDPKTGQIRVRPKKGPHAPSAYQQFAQKWRSLGVPQYQIDAAWELRTEKG